MAFGATNLLTNGDFSAGTSAGWTVIQNGGSGASFVGVFATSYEWASISQTVDLVAAGYTTAELDAAPGLIFTVDTYQRFDHDGEYYLEYKLLAADGTTVLASQLYGSAASPLYLSPSTDWFGTEHTFTGYGSGVRYAYIKIAGRDGSPNWGGHYGPYFDNASIAMADSTNPTVSYFNPANGATNVAVDADLEIAFTEAVATSTGNIVLYKAADDSVVETIPVTSALVSASGTTAFLINPTADLEELTEYYVTVAPTAVDDTSGNSFLGITASTTWSFTTVDETAPTVSITAPIAGEEVRGNAVSIGATASDAGSILGVKFYVDNVLYGSEDTTSPFSFSWDSTTASNGAHSVFAVARDAASLYATSSVVSFTVSNVVSRNNALSPTSARKISIYKRINNDLVREKYQRAVEQSARALNDELGAPIPNREKIVRLMKLLFAAFQAQKKEEETYVVRAEESVPVFIKDLYVADEGEDVSSLQRFLIERRMGPSALELARVGATGYFGSYTKEALAEFQKSVGITPSLGYYGALTRAYIADMF